MANLATRVNASGFIETVADNVPRLDYPLGGIANGCPGLLVEPSGTNVVVQSQNWLASGWRDDATSNVTTVTATTGTRDPLGTNTANAISPTSGSTSHLKIGSDGAISFTSGTIYSSSAFFKQGTGNAGRYVQLNFPTAQFGQLGYANFDLQLGAVSVVSGTSADTNRAASIENYGNGWYRCRFTATCNASGTGNGISVALIETSGATRIPSFAGTVTDVLYGWGAQTETGSIATSYIPTTTAAITRAADTITKTGVSSLIGQTEGTIYAEVVLSRVNTSPLITISDGSDSNRIQIAFASATSLIAIIRIAGANANYTVTIPTIPATGGVYKMALGYKTDDYCFALNGTAYASTASRGVPACNKIGLGTSATDGAFLNDRIRASALYPTRLTNAQLQALTT
jgi:hypothetical protein